MKRLGEFREIDGQRYELTIPEEGDPPRPPLPASNGSVDRYTTRLIALGFLTPVY